jgi:hypothetical protein
MGKGVGTAVVGCMGTAVVGCMGTEGPQHLGMGSTGSTGSPEGAVFQIPRMLTDMPVRCRAVGISSSPRTPRGSATKICPPLAEESYESRDNRNVILLEHAMAEVLTTVLTPGV